MRYKFINFVIFLISISFVGASFSEQPREYRGIVFSGARVDFDAIYDQGFFYISNYAADKHLSIDIYEESTGLTSNKKTPFLFDGKDSHKYISMALDGNKNVHISALMHNSPLVYMVLDSATKDLIVHKRMSNICEDEVTYPNFFYIKSDLAFSYRCGRSGQGVTYINKYVDGWVSLTPNGLFAHEVDFPASAYHTQFTSSSDGFYHVAWVWRNDENVDSTHDIHYAKTKDFIGWTNLEGKAIKPPFTPRTNSRVKEIGVKSGLTNPIKISLIDDVPFLTYTRFDELGRMQVFVLRIGDFVSETQVTSFDENYYVGGGGTLKRRLDFYALTQQQGKIIQKMIVDGQSRSYEFANGSFVEGGNFFNRNSVRSYSDSDEIYISGYVNNIKPVKGRSDCEIQWRTRDHNRDVFVASRQNEKSILRLVCR